MNEQKILDFDPFEGDFGAPGDKVFTNLMVTARKPGPCSHCEAEITKGERVRRQVSKFDGELMTHRWCALCCKAMADYEDQLCDENRETLPDYEYRHEQAAQKIIKLCNSENPRQLRAMDKAIQAANGIKE